jgi:hypothetical protein
MGEALMWSFLGLGVGFMLSVILASTAVRGGTGGQGGTGGPGGGQGGTGGKGGDVRRRDDR